LPTSAETFVVDTSVALAMLDAGDPAGVALRAPYAGRPLGLSGHAAFETYSVLTRRPSPHRVSARAAALLIERAFPHPCPAVGGVELVRELAGLGIDGGAIYDGLVGAAARSIGATLLTRDRRAERTYRLLHVDFRLV
jgi:predicted nucleic acid-binding protein